MVKYDWESGTKFGRLICTGKSYMNGKIRFVEVICECGVIKWIIFRSIKRGATKSCGCLNRDLLIGNKRTTFHGITNHPIYFVWQGMKQRCYYEKANNFGRYGAKGVSICPEWLNDPKAFYDWSMSNGWQEGLTIDRYPNKKGNYTPENCRWATEQQQVRNRVSNVIVEIFGEQKCLIEWQEDKRCIVSAQTLK